MSDGLNANSGILTGITLGSRWDKEVYGWVEACELGLRKSYTCYLSEVQPVYLDLLLPLVFNDLLLSVKYLKN